MISARRLFLFDRRDAAWLRARVHDPFHPDANPSWGMFNTGQKILAWALGTSVVIVIVTGVLSWSHGGEGGLHGAAVLLTGLLLTAHVFMAVVNPSTRPALHGMVFGRVRHSWAAQASPCLDRRTRGKTMSLMNGPTRRVVVGVDLSAGAESLVRWADQQAAARDAVLYAVTVPATPLTGP